MNQQEPLLYTTRPDDLGHRLVAEAYLPEYLFVKRQLEHCASLKDVTEITSGTTPHKSAFDGGTILFLKTQHIQEGYLNLFEKYYINDEADDTILRKSRVVPGDVLITIIGASADIIGRAVAFPTSLARANINQNIARIRVFDQELVRPDYVEAFLNSPLGRLQTQMIARCVGQFNLNIPEVASIKIPLPAPEMQKEIADIWTAWKTLRRTNLLKIGACREEVDEKFVFSKNGISLPKIGDINFFTGPATDIGHGLTAERFRAALVKRVLEAQQQELNLMRLSDLVEFRQERISPQESPETFYQLVQVGFNGVTKLREERLGRDIKYKEMKLVKAGDILVSRINAIHGAISVVPKRFDRAIVSDECHVLIPRKDHVETTYLWMILRTAYVRALLEGQTTGGTKLRVPEETLRELPIPVPPMQTQNAFSTHVKHDLRLVRELAREIRDARERSKAQIQKTILQNLTEMTFDAWKAKMKTITKDVIASNVDALRELAKY